MLIWGLIAIGVVVVCAGAMFGGSRWKNGAAEIDDSELEDYQDQFVSHEPPT